MIEKIDGSKNNPEKSSKTKAGEHIPSDKKKTNPNNNILLQGKFQKNKTYLKEVFTVLYSHHCQPVSYLFDFFTAIRYYYFIFHQIFQYLEYHLKTWENSMMYTEGKIAGSFVDC